MTVHELNFDIIPRVVRRDVISTVRILPLGNAVRFDDGIDYTLTFIPTAISGETYIAEEILEDSFIPSLQKPEIAHTQTLRVRPQNGVLSFDFCFTDEQEWVIRVEGDRMPHTPVPFLASFHVYAVGEDLYERSPLVGDLHAHSCLSDGSDDPGVVAAAYRKYGYDFFALTDHHTWHPSDDLIRRFRNVPTDLTIFHGEEIHLKESYLHIVSVGGSHSVNDYYNEDPEARHREILALAEKEELPDGINRLEYAYRRWVAEKIHEFGGIAVIAHPYWIYGHKPEEFHMRENMLDFLISHGLYDAMEGISGQSPHENNLQIMQYFRQREKKTKIGLLASSDSHSVRPDADLFRTAKTIAFVRGDLTVASLRETLSEGYTVAWEHAVGDAAYRVYGDYRLVKYTRFLLSYYFPLHDEMCVEEGRLLRAYSAGDESAADELRRLSGRTGALARRLLHS